MDQVKSTADQATDQAPGSQTGNQNSGPSQKSYYQSAKETASSYMPWAENMYLKYFTNDNKASYATKDYLSKTKIPGTSQTDAAQDQLHEAVGSTIGQNGPLSSVGDAVSKEGIDRAETGGSRADGSWVPESVSSAASGAAGYMPSLGGKKESK